jgi:lysophospholipase L1-like esterase
MMRHRPLWNLRASRVAAAAAAISLSGMLAAHPSAQSAERWDPAIQRFEDRDKVSPPPQNGIVFIGSSSIVRWNLPEYFPELGERAVNRGFGGSQSADAVRYVDRIVVPYHPRIVVYYSGDNDIEANVSAREIAQQFEFFDHKVHAALPQTKIIVISVKPSFRRWKWIDTIESANAMVKAYCAKEKHLTFMDIEQQMLGADGMPNPDLLNDDGLHLTAAGYRIWTAALKPLLKEQ